MNSLIVMLGGALGALGRYQFGRMATHVMGPGWPWGTLGVNIIGGFLMGVLAGWLARHGSVTVGRDPQQALMRLEWVEQAARILLAVRQATGRDATPLPAEDVATLRAMRTQSRL